MRHFSTGKYQSQSYVRKKKEGKCRINEKYIYGESKKNMLGRFLTPNGEEITGCWRKLQNEELRSLLVYSSLNNIRMITASSMVRWARHVAQIHTKFWQKTRWKDTTWQIYSLRAG